jgi:hypothetical protein
MMASLRQAMHKSLSIKTDLLTSLDIDPQDEHFFLRLKF